MNNTVAGIAGFIFGAAAGTAVTWYILRARYEEERERDKELMRKVYEKRAAKEEEKQQNNDILEQDEKASEENKHKPDIKEYAEMIQKENYTNYSDRDPEKGDSVLRMKKFSKVQSISPVEYGEDPDYDKMDLTYYADGILTYSDTDRILEEDQRYYVGDNFADLFGEYEEDTVFLRNDTNMTYYEITRDLQTYEEACGKRPEPVEVQ